MSTVDLGRVVVGLASVPSQHKAHGGSSQFAGGTYGSLAEAASKTPISLREPAYLPAGVRLLDVNVLRQPREMAILTYEDQRLGTSLVLVLSPLDGQAKQTHLSVGDAIEKAKVGSQPAALIQLGTDRQRNGPFQTTLVWVEGETVYQAIGVGLSRSDLIKVAESI